ncbi:hypothetical protein DHD05_09010 [Arenibacter sp. N53]|nr:hypothetical protein [Arenibacter sp. N53]
MEPNSWTDEYSRILKLFQQNLLNKTETQQTQNTMTGRPMFTVNQDKPIFKLQLQFRPVFEPVLKKNNRSTSLPVKGNITVYQGIHHQLKAQKANRYLKNMLFTLYIIKN